MAGRALSQPQQRKETQTEPTMREDIEGAPAALHEQIRRRAHELFVEHSGHNRSELDDWLQAEAEILQTGSKRG
jgi:hypothetical protein